MGDSIQVAALPKFRTSGEFETEAEAWTWFDAIVDKANGFRVYSEVRGEYIQPRALTEDKSPRIDRLMIPLQKAIDSGWIDGAIGVEGKKSDHKIGRLVAQALDYSRAVFRLEKGVPGLMILPTWTFIYPVDFPSSDIGSVMAQSRIGCVSPSDRGLWFTCGGMNALVIRSDGSIEAKSLPMGRKRGSR